MPGTTPIAVTIRDRERLLQVADSFVGRRQGVLVRFLLQEVARAAIVASEAIPRDVATMNSRLRYRDDLTGEIRTVSLVYPGEEDTWLGRVSIVSPTGTALIGLSEGQTIGWRDLGGGERRLTLLQVIHQPEAAGRHDL
jgi:regulator of nucleoside diphosphate kinase